ncbi:MAG: hypothetical protein DI538_15630 [Azospira oryzae]|jgi:hypothetical protein|nr:MAG: hypothetical protein DI538_15630 [Azospira oryzae]
MKPYLMKYRASQYLLSVVVCLFIHHRVLSQSIEQKMDYSVKQRLDHLRIVSNEVNQYVPENKKYLSQEEDEKWLLRAVSLKARNKWADQEMLNSQERELFNAEFKQLTSSIAAKIQLHKPSLSLFHSECTAQEEQSMKAELSNGSNLHIYKIGIAESEIEQLATSASQKRGYIWARNPADDYPYCHLYEFKITRAYSGNGNYEGAIQIVVTDDILVGCQ